MSRAMWVNIIAMIALSGLTVWLKMSTVERQVILAWLYLPLLIGWPVCWTAAKIFDDIATREAWAQMNAQPTDATAGGIFIVGLGLTVLLATFLPIGGWLVDVFFGGTARNAFAQRSPALFDVAVLSANYIPTAIIAAVIIYKTHVYRWLPADVPGKRQILIGVAFLIANLLLRLFVALAPGRSAAFLAILFNIPIFVLAADIVIIIGLTRAFLAALLPVQVYVEEPPFALSGETRLPEADRGLMTMVKNRGAGSGP